MTPGQLCILLLMGSIMLLNYLRYRDVLYPPVIHSGIWTGVLLLYVLNQDLMFPLSPLLYGIILSGVILFSLGGYLATRKHRPSRKPLPEIPFTPKPVLLKLLFWAPILGLIPFLLKAYSFSQQGPFDNFFMNIRYTANTLEERGVGGAFGLSAYFMPLSYASVMLQTLFAEYRKHSGKYTASVLAACTYAFFSTARASFLLLLVALASILLLTRRLSPLKALLSGGTTFLALFIGLGLLAGKAGKEHGTLGESISTVYKVLVAYIAGSLPAFDMHMEMHPGWEAGQNVFRTFYAVLAALGFEVPVKHVIPEYVFVPFPTNMYTMYRPYYNDFALWGVFLIPLVLGLVHGFLYRKATEGHLFFILAYALSLMPLMTQFFNDGYFTALSLWTQYAIIWFVYFYRLRFLPPEAYRRPYSLGPAAT